jgi:CheY-like chemotaxis protein
MATLPTPPGVFPCDGIAHVLTRFRSVGPFTFERLSPRGGVLRGKPPVRTGRVVSMVVHLPGGSFRIDAEVCGANHAGDPAEQRWEVLFRNISGATERVLWELASGQRTPRLPRVAVLDQSMTLRDPLAIALSSRGRVAEFFSTRGQLEAWETGGGVFTTLFVESSLVEDDDGRLLHALAERYPDRRRVLLCHPDYQPTPLPFGAVHGLLALPWRSDALEEALGISANRESPVERRILFVDDEPFVLAALQTRLRRELRSWHTVLATSGEAALAELRAQSFDLVITDLKMAGLGGVSLLEAARRQSPRALRVVLSGHDSPAARKLAHHVLSKPCPAESLGAVLAEAARRANGAE